MKKQYDSTDAYYLLIFNRLLIFAPIVALCAALVFTGARLFGFFSFVHLPQLIFFDFTSIIYFLLAYDLKRRGVVKNGIVDDTKLTWALIAMDIIIIFQWNIITYIFPTRDFWGYAPMFVMLTAFMFKTNVVLVEIGGLSASIAVSWMINGDKLLPIRDELFTENLILRIVALVISFTVIAVLTYFAEKFTLLTKENFSSLVKQNEALENKGRDIIDFTADIIEERDSTSGLHVKRLKVYTRVLAEQIAEDYPEYGLEEDKIEVISMASALHDVGKIAIPDSILSKPGKLTPEEFDVIKTHTVLGAKIIDKLPDSVGEEYKRYCREICQFHHEKYDGKGYPIGLKGDEIPISAQIVSVVDCYDALTHERPYKNALPGDLAMQMILNGECGAFSEKMKNSLIKCRERILKIC